MNLNLYSLLGVIFAGIIILTIVILILRKFSIIEAGKTGIKLAGKNKTYSSCLYTYCAHQKFSLILLTVSETYASIRKLEDSILKNQMIYTEQKIELMKEKILEKYLYCVVKHVGDKNNLEKTDHFQSFCNVCFRLMYELKSLFRMFFKDNHFKNKNALDWENYKKEKIEYLNTIADRELSITYLTNMPIRLNELKENLGGNFLDSVREEIYEIFNRCKKINIEKDKDIEKKKIELDDFGRKMCGKI